jgi:hypothetical protein
MLSNMGCAAPLSGHLYAVDRICSATHVLLLLLLLLLLQTCPLTWRTLSVLTAT